MKTFVLLFFILLSSSAGAVDYYYQSGDPVDPSNWNSQLNGGGSSPANFTDGGYFMIPNGRTAIVYTPWYFGGAGCYLRVEPGGTLKNDIGIQMNSQTGFILDSGSLYINNNISIASLTIFNGLEIFNQYSTIRIDNWSSPNDPVYNGVDPTYGYYFGNLEINWGSLSTVWEQKINSSNTNIFCRNNLIVDSTGTGSIRFHDETSGISSGQATVKIKGNLIQNGGNINLFTGYTIPEVYKTNFELYGDFIQNNGIFGAGGSSFGKITFAKQAILGPDTSYQKFYTQFPTHNSNMRYNVNPWGALRLMSNMYGNFTDTACGLYVYGGSGGASAAIDFQSFKVYNSCRIKTDNSVSLYLGSPMGYRNNSGGLPEGNLAPDSPLLINLSSFTKLIFSGTVPQVTGNEMPDILGSLSIRNTSGVTLSKNLKTFELYLLSGTLNLGDYNLTIPDITYITGNSINNFINTNGEGFFKTFIGSATGSKLYPVGNTTYCPLLSQRGNAHTPDTFAIRIRNGFLPGYIPSDTSYCIRKTWEIVENTQGGSQLRFWFQWRHSDEGSNFNYAKYLPYYGTVGVYNANSYDGYKPFAAAVFEYPFNGPLDTTIARSATTYGNEPLYQDFNLNNKFVVGMQRGIYEYYYYNSGNGSSLNSWKKNEDGTGVSPQSFDRYEAFHVAQNKNAIFNSSVTFSNKTFLRLTGNGQLTSNQPITNLGSFDLYDSSTYNHNNIGVAANTIFAGQESFGANTTYNITMWSDTANAIRDGFQGALIGNLVINFTNLADPGANGRWRNIKTNPASLICRNLKYIQSSGYDLCIVGTTNANFPFTSIIMGSVQIGDSIIAPDANPILNLSYGTAQLPGSSAGKLEIQGNLDIQRGMLRSEPNPAIANGSIAFTDLNNNFKHYISSYQPLDPAIMNVGNSAYPNYIGQPDTIVLRSNFYNSVNAPSSLPDFFEILDQTVFDCDTFAFRGMNLRVKKGGKIIIRNKEGINFNLANLQNITFEDGGMLELAGYENQNLYKAGSTPMPNIPYLVVNNPHGITINDITTITDTLRFIQGKLNSVLTLLQFTDTTASIGATNSSYIEAPVKLFTKSTITKIIPLGKNGKLRPLYFQPADVTPSQWTVLYDTQDPHTIGSTYGPGINNISSNEYYFINKYTSTIGAYVGLSFGPESGVSNIDSLKIARWNGSLWEDKGAITRYGNASSGYVISDYCTDFDFFAISSTNAQPLPVELSSFNSSVVKNDVTLNWSTSLEQNNRGFELERKSSADTIWRKIGFISGAGNSNNQNNYKYSDANLASGKYFYRLKQIDNNGNYKYYVLQNEVNVGIPQKFSLSQNYPNPFNPSTKIDFDLPKDAKVSLNIYDMTGRLVSTLINNETYTVGYHTVQFNASSLSSGTYFYRISAADNVQTKKMTLIK
jgi:hypothetical protein